MPLKAIVLLTSFLAATIAQGQSAPDMPEAFTDLLASRTAECVAFDNGVIDVPDDAIKRFDLTGDGNLDWVFDEYGMTCSTAVGLFCGGTGGCHVTFLIDDVASSYMNKGWEVVDLGPIRTILLQVHGSNCGGTNLTYCVDALVWDAEFKTFRSVAPSAD